MFRKAGGGQRSKDEIVGEKNKRTRIITKQVKECKRRELGRNDKTKARVRVN